MNTYPLEAGSDGALSTVMPAGRLFRAYLTEAKYECVRMFRVPAFAGPFLALPVLLYLLFAVLLYGPALRSEPAGALFTFTAFSILGVIGPGLFAFGITIAMEREQGLFTLKRALPTPPAAYLLSKMLMSMMFVAIVMVTMIAAAPLGHLRLTAGQLLSVAVINIWGALPFCAIGLFIGTRVTGKSAPGFVNLVYFLMLYLSGFLIPLPKSIQWIAFASPAYYLNQLVRRVEGASSQGPPLMHIAILTGFTLALTAIALRRLKRVG